MWHLNLSVFLLVEVTQDQTRMALRKQTAKDVSDVPSESRQIDEDTQEDEAIDDADAKVESCEVNTDVWRPVTLVG